MTNKATKGQRWGWDLWRIVSRWRVVTYTSDYASSAGSLFLKELRP
jgi:hypothetical protein